MAKPSRTPRILHGIFLILLIAFCVVKLWPSDKYEELALLAYAPSPLILAMALLLIVWCWKTDSRIVTAIATIVLAASLFFIAKENPSLFRRSQLMATKSPTVRILHWNVWNVRMGAQPIANEISKQNPQVICLNEAQTRIEREYPFSKNPFSTHLEGSWHECADGNSLILSKLPMQELKLRRWKGIQVVYVQINSEIPFKLMLVDVRSNFLLYRKGVLDSLMERLDEWNFRPDLIVGDFNTPEGSYSLMSTLEMSYTDAYRIAGHGIGYTWPVWIPSMRIDLILTRNPGSVVQHRIGWSNLSDHRWQWIDYR